MSDESKGYRLYDPKGKKIVVSKDVVFEEERQWDWDSEFGEQVLVDLEWVGDQEQDDPEEFVDDDEVVPSSEEEVSGSSSSSSQSSSSSEERRPRRAPAYLNDYVSGQGFSDGEFDVNFAFFTNADPINFEEAIQSSEWKEAMNCEMKSIEKNGTWVLTDLPAGAKKI